MLSFHAALPIDAPGNNLKDRDPVVQVSARFLARLPCNTKLTGARGWGRRRIAWSLAPPKRMSRRQLHQSGALCALAAVEAHSVHGLF